MKLSLFVISLASAAWAEHHAGKRSEHAAIANKMRSVNDTEIAERSLHKREFYGPPNQNNRYTWYDVGLGACGNWNVESDFIVAMNSGRFQQNGGYSQYPPCICGMQIQISYGGSTQNAVVQDECPTCPGIGDLDLSKGLFSSLAGLGAGELWGGSWTVLYDPCNPNGNPPPQQPAPAPAPSPSQDPPPSSSQNPTTTTPGSSSSSSSAPPSSSSDIKNVEDAPGQNLQGLTNAVMGLGRFIWQAAGHQGHM